MFLVKDFTLKKIKKIGKTCVFIFFLELTVIVCVKLGFQLFHLPLVSQKCSVFLQGTHAILLLLLHRLLDQRVFLVVCNAWGKKGFPSEIGGKGFHMERLFFSCVCVHKGSAQIQQICNTERIGSTRKQRYDVPILLHIVTSSSPTVLESSTMIVLTAPSSILIFCGLCFFLYSRISWLKTKKVERGGKCE